MREILTSFLILFLLASCSTTNTGTAKSIDIVGSGVLHKPVIADLIVDQSKSSKTISYSKMESLESAKNNAIRELLKENNADVLVEPTFESSTTGSTTQLTVYGWTAKYNNFRQIEEDDIKFLEVQPNYIQKAESHQPSVSTNNKSLVGIVLSSVGVIALGLILGSVL